MVIKMKILTFIENFKKKILQIFGFLEKELIVFNKIEYQWYHHRLVRLLMILGIKKIINRRVWKNKLLK